MYVHVDEAEDLDMAIDLLLNAHGDIHVHAHVHARVGVDANLHADAHVHARVDVEAQAPHGHFRPCACLAGALLTPVRSMWRVENQKNQHMLKKMLVRPDGKTQTYMYM